MKIGDRVSIVDFHGTVQHEAKGTVLGVRKQGSLIEARVQFDHEMWPRFVPWTWLRQCNAIERLAELA